MAVNPGIHERRLRILAAIQAHQNKYKVPPTLRELCALTDITSTSLLDWHLDVLEEQGLITRKPNRSRTIRLVGEAPQDFTMKPEEVEKVVKKSRNYYGSSDAPVADPVIGLPYKLEPPRKFRRQRTKRK